MYKLHHSTLIDFLENSFNGIFDPSRAHNAAMNIVGAGRLACTSILSWDDAYCVGRCVFFCTPWAVQPAP